MKREIGNALWWIGTIDLVAAVLIIGALMGSLKGAFSFLGVNAGIAAVLWTAAYLLGGAVWFPATGRKHLGAHPGT